MKFYLKSTILAAVMWFPHAACAADVGANLKDSSVGKAAGGWNNGFSAAGDGANLKASSVGKAVGGWNNGFSPAGDGANLKASSVGKAVGGWNNGFSPAGDILLSLALSTLLEINKQNEASSVGKAAEGRKNNNNNIAKGDDGFSACLLVKDDNHWMGEWIAYHYHALPLRNLIVAVDPDSVSSPEKILNRWKNTMKDLDILLWHDKDYREKSDIISSLEEKLEAEKNEDTKTLKGLHDWRQNVFFGQCMRHHKSKGRSWVALVDTDEFIAFNNRYNLSSDSKDETIFEFIKKNEGLFDSNSCISMTRTLFGPMVDETSMENDFGLTSSRSLKEKLSGGINRQDFRISNYFYHDVTDKSRLARFAKVVMNVRRFSHEELAPRNILNIHHPNKKCPDSQKYISADADATSVFRVHHYLGDFQDYSSKSDVLRTKEIYEEKAKAASQEGPNFELRDWLPQFIGKVGPAVAKYVLPTKEEKTPVKSSGNSGCALLFFGLARRFEAVFPTLQKNVLNSNPGCKIFFHTYDASTSYEDGTEVSIETNNIRLLIESASGYVVETEEDFQSKRDTKKYLQFFPHEALPWNFPDSLENMIRQWHSIESAWNVMSKYEMETKTKFKRVGLFRLDVIYEDPIDINPIELESAVIPSMMYSSHIQYSQYNDRMFYGTRMYAEIWATDRFSSVNDFLYWQDHNHGMRIIKGLHSESFMYFLLREKWNLPISEKDICFKRIRSTGKIKGWDCDSFGTPNDGLFVLGMHRSGTSLLTGLLEHGAGLVLPGNRIRPDAANTMGYFESQDVITVNNMWLQKQGLTWDAPYKTIEVDDSSLTTFNSSHPFISSSICPDPSMDRYCNARDRVLNDYTRGYYRTWVIKDPRMCLTLRAWVDLLGSRQDNNFAVLFTYRNPLEVARSLQNRKHDKVQNLSFGLKLWILYNQMAITNSKNMCRVVTSNEAILQNPVNEIKRIGGSLARKCNFKEYEYNEKEILKFLNKDFMHHTKTIKPFLLKESHPCTVPPFNSSAISTEERKTEKALYREAMMIFCDLKSGKAFQDDYVWPYQLELNEATETWNDLQLNAKYANKVVKKAWNTNVHRQVHRLGTKHDSSPLLFLHVGKAGGGTVRTQSKIRWNVDVPRFHPTPPNATEMDEIRSKYKVLLVNLRDPVDRFMSAFYWTMRLTCDPSGDTRKPDQKRPTVFPDLYCRPNPNMMAFHDKYNRDANELASALCSSDHERAKQASEDMRHIPHSNHHLVDWLGLVLSDLKLADTLFPIVLEPSFDFESQIDDAIRWSYNISSSDTSDTPDTSETDLDALHRNKHTSNGGANKELSERNQACIAQHYSSDYKLLQQIKDEACRTATCKEAIRSIQRRRSKFLKQDASIEEQPGRRLVVSIGPPKTATSTLQEFFNTYASDQNAETKAAAFENWNYPIFWGERNGLMHLTHQNSTSNIGIEKLLREQSSTKNILLVSEHLSVRFYDKPKIEHLERWTNTKAEIVVTHRTPRVSHLISNWKEVTQRFNMRKEFGKYENSFRDFMCDSSHNRSLIFLEHQTNTLKLASKAIENNWPTYLIDSGGLGGQDIAHAFGCDVLRLNCPDGMWLEGLEDVTVHKNLKFGDPNLTEMERINLENIFAQRDCAFREELENNPLLTILHRKKLWENCTIVEPKYRHDPYFMLTKMRDVLCFPTPSSDGEKIVVQESYVLALMERLLPSRIDFLSKLPMLLVVVVVCRACFRRRLARAQKNWMVLAMGCFIVMAFFENSKQLQLSMSLTLIPME